MKRRIGLLVFAVLLLFCAFALADIDLDAKVFPDENFRAIVQQYDQDGNGRLSDAEIAGIKEIYCSNKNITSFQGIEYLTALTHLDCGLNKLKALDVSKNTALVYLSCFSNRLTSLTIGKNTVLKELWCFDNMLEKLDLSGCRGLKLLSSHSNSLKKLDISKNPALISLVNTHDPYEYAGHWVWETEEQDDSAYQLLTVDKSVTLVTEAAEPVDISSAAVKAIKDQEYTGKAVRPAVTVKYDGKKLIKGTDYTVAYKNNLKIGTAKVIITGKGSYTGKKTASFRIVPRGVALSSLTAGKQLLSVQWQKGSNITGYQIEYSLKKDFSTSRTITVSKADANKKVIRNLKAGKTWYVRIRTFKTVDGKKYRSAWSAALSAKTK